MNSVILTAVSYSNTRYTLLLHLLALDGIINNEDITTATRVSLQSSSELLSRKCTLQGRSCPVLGLQDVMWVLRHCLGERYWNVEKHIPIPDCFFPPNGTLLFSILYWFTHTCKIENRSIGTDETDKNFCEYVRHLRCQLPAQMKHACIDWRHLAIQWNEIKEDWWMRKRANVLEWSPAPRP